MGSNFFAAFLMLLLAISGGPPDVRHNDLLDMIPTEAYWQAKHVVVTRAQLESDVGAAKPVEDVAKLVKDLESLSRREAAKKALLEAGPAALDLLRTETQSDDPEAAAMAKNLVDLITLHGKEREVRRLMAIRTLGERKEKESLGLLKSLADSKEMFVADYAARAVAQIEGAPLKPAAAVNLEDDLKMLPANTGMVGQTRGLGLPGFTVEGLVEQMLNLTPPNGPAVNPADKNKLVESMTQQLVDIAETVGNVRADGATVAISADIGGSNEWFLIAVRGEYDREAVAAYAAKMGRMDRPAPVTRDGEMLKLDTGGSAVALFPSDREMVIVVANPADTPLASVLDPVADALATGKPNTLAENKPLDDLLKTVDKTGPLWMAGIPSAKMRSMMPIFAAFDTMKIETKEEKGEIKLTGTAKGTGDVQAAVDQFNAVKANLLPSVQRLVTISKDFQVLADAVDSATMTAEDKGASAKATVGAGAVKSVVASILAVFRLWQMPVNGGNGPGMMPGNGPQFQGGVEIDDFTGPQRMPLRN